MQNQVSEIKTDQGMTAAEYSKYSVVTWDNENQLMRIFSIGDYNEQIAREQSNDILTKVAQHSQGKKINTLTDLSKAGKATPGAQMVFIDLIRNEIFEKQAFIGMTGLTKTFFSLILLIAKPGNIKLFDTEAEALKWLKE